jgi:hypothetical protein
VDSGAYRRILEGEYPRRDDDPTASVSADVKAAAESYRESFRRSHDPLVNLQRRLGDGGLGEWVNSGAGRVRDWVSGAARGRRGPGPRPGADGEERPQP